MNSMTGFGYAENISDDGVQISVSLKSLNNRYLDISVVIPSSLTVLEGRVRNHLQRAYSRGRLELHVRIQDDENTLTVAINETVAKVWKSALENLADFLGTRQEIPLDMLLQQEGVFRVERMREPEIYWPLLESLLISAEKQVLTDRKREGLRLAQDIENQLSVLEDALVHITKRAPHIKTEVEKVLRTRFHEIVGDYADEARIQTEIAAWIVKTDTNEELIRLGIHIDAFREEAVVQGANGKKLDFLSQEMSREINTIGAKTPRTDVSHHVVNMKDAVEKIREQLRNVE